MKGTTVYLVQLADPVREIALVAARENFPRDQLQLVPVRTVAEAIRLPGQERQLLVIGEAGDAEIALAAQALDANELPRWAVVHLSSAPSDLVESVPLEECTVGLLSRVLRASALHHELLRENLQLRGDLKTIARRFNHDIRTPLGCINTVLALLQETGAGGRSAQEATSVIRSSTDEISVLLDRLSFVLKASSEPLPGQQMPMGPVVQKAIAQLAEQDDFSPGKIAQPAQWPEARAVEAWTVFVWRTLIHNAVRHGGRGRPVQLGWEPRGGDLRFWVSSEGPVPPALQGNLLRPFHLLHQQPSAGLGLSLVERIVALQGGRCGYETTPDRHALFHFTLPNAKAAPRAPAPRPSLAESHGS